MSATRFAPPSIVPEIAKYQELAGPGKCAFCLDDIADLYPAGRFPVHCFSAGCARFYQALYKAHWRQEHPGSDKRTGRYNRKEAEL